MLQAVRRIKSSLVGLNERSRPAHMCGFQRGSKTETTSLLGLKQPTSQRNEALRYPTYQLTRSSSRNIRKGYAHVKNTLPFHAFKIRVASVTRTTKLLLRAEKVVIVALIFNLTLSDGMRKWLSDK